MKKVPFPISIDKDLAERVMHEVENGKFRNRSHLIEEALKQFRERRKNG